MDRAKILEYAIASLFLFIVSAGLFIVVMLEPVETRWMYDDGVRMLEDTREESGIFWDIENDTIKNYEKN